MKRHVIPELLDADLGTPSEIAASLRDLRHINSWFGGTATSVELLRRIAERRHLKRLSLLEVGAGSGDVALDAQDRLSAGGLTLDVTLLDRAPSHLPHNGVPSVAGDALSLPFADDSFDVVGCCLFAHHFDPDQLARLAAEGLRVARHAFLINDLIRSRLHVALVYAGLPLFRSRVTWHDAPASVRAAYTVKEMREILNPLPAQRVEVSRHYLYRVGVLLWK